MNLPIADHSSSGSQQQSAPILLLPGWLDSGPDHWQTCWETRFGFQRVVQSDWVWPRRGDWMSRLEEFILEQAGPVVLVAHSLGCHLVAAWAAHSAHGDRILGALLVAPPDLEREQIPPNLFNWRPVVRQRLPFPSRVVASDNDPFASLQQTQAMAASWGSELTVLASFGHLNGESGLGDWPQGLGLVDDLLAGRVNQSALR